MADNSLALGGVESKVCSKCCADKPVSEFYRMGGKRAGYRTICKACAISRARLVTDALSPMQRAMYKRSCGEVSKDAPYISKAQASENSRLAAIERSAASAARIEARALARAARIEMLVSPAEIAKRRASAEKDYRKKVGADPVGMRVIWRRAKHIRRLKSKGQSDGTLDREGFAGLYDQTKSCPYCACKLTRREPSGWRSTDATLDHLIPISKGGVHGMVNVVVCCSRCNFSKNNLMPFEWAEKLIGDMAKSFRRLYMKRYGVTLDQPPLL